MAASTSKHAFEHPTSPGTGLPSPDVADPAEQALSCKMHPPPQGKAVRCPGLLLPSGTAPTGSALGGGSAALAASIIPGMPDPSLSLPTLSLPLPFGTACKG